MNATKILSIDPGTRQLGVAVLDGNDLLYYGVKTLAKRSTAVDIRAEAARIRALIAEYQPDVVAIEQQVTRQNAMMLNAVAREIKKTVKGIGLAVYEYAPKTVRQFICSNDGKATKRRTAQHIATRYPELMRYLTRRSKWEELYYARMFDAIAVGLTCSHMIGESHTTAT